MAPIEGEKPTINIEIPGLDAVSIKPPAFYSQDPETWFSILEAQFQIAKITAESTQYYHLLSKLDGTIAADVSHIVNKTFEAGQYQKLKDELIRIHSESEQRRLNVILDTEQLGDRTPSQFYRFLQSKVGKLTISDDILYNRWLSKLPTSIQCTISGLDRSKLPMADVLKTADNVFEITQSSTAKLAAVSTGPQRARSSSISNQGSFRGRSHSPGPRKSGTFNENGRLCWYHWRYGAKAQKCNDKCQWKKPGNARQ